MKAASLLWSSFGTRPQEDVAYKWIAMLDYFRAIYAKNEIIFIFVFENTQIQYQNMRTIQFRGHLRSDE
jgi:hypothetical protein